MSTFAGNHFYCWNCGKDLDWYEICNCTDESSEEEED
jgi:hypothetical protein